MSRFFAVPCVASERATANAATWTELASSVHAWLPGRWMEAFFASGVGLAMTFLAHIAVRRRGKLRCGALIRVCILATQSSCV